MISTLGSTEYIIHHPSHVDVYALTKEQLELVSSGEETEWKDYFQNALSVMLTCVINILALGWQTESASFSLNAGLCMLSFAIAVGSFYMYRIGQRNRKTRLTDILKQPVQRIKTELEEL